MRILHTADWHIGQTFHEYDRSYEHQQFLNWLVGVINEQMVEVLLISGDVFDLSNPSAASIKMFYSFLRSAINKNPQLQIIITAGNHDSAARLESPKPLLESSNIHIIGVVEKLVDGVIDYEKLLIPLKDADGSIKVWCLAVPFLRMGDYPVVITGNNPYADGVTKLYEELYQVALSKLEVGQQMIAMGHLHTQKAEVTDADTHERLIMGGVECVSASAFDTSIAYVALGHIHKAQQIGGQHHIRYSGSPIPMSFSEINYKHQVVIFDIDATGVTNLISVEVPISVSLLRVPSKNSQLAEVLTALDQLPACDTNRDKAPYLEVRVLLDGPEPGLRHKIETALVGKNVRLAKIDVKYPATTKDATNSAVKKDDQLQELKPAEVFAKLYQSKFSSPIPEAIQKLFNQVTEAVAVNELT